MLLRAFQFTARYIDDLFSIDCEHWTTHTYTSQTDAFGFTGIYPDTLSLLETSTEHPDRAAYMDVFVFFSFPATVGWPAGGPLTTHLYDKRRSAAFADIPLVRLPHISAMLPANCKYNILVAVCSLLAHHHGRREPHC